jgi:hypothetical protein
MPVVGSNRRGIAFLLLLILSLILLSTTNPCRATNSGKKYEFDSEINLGTSLANQMKVDDVKIQNVLNISYIFVNDEDFDIYRIIPQGDVAWKPENLTVQSASLNDNQGQTFTFINYSGIIMNPELKGWVRAHSIYTLSLIVVMMPGAFYVDQLQAWQFTACVNSSSPVQVRITLPINFSSPFYAPGAECTRDQSHKVYTWHNSLSQQAVNISVVFLPFPYNPETISLNFSTVISSVFPTVGGMTGTVTNEFRSLAFYDGLAVPPIFELSVLFPISYYDTQVVSVYDINGSCVSLPDRLSTIDYTNAGTYYVDPKNGVVIVYPRARTSENLYHYIVGVSFDFGALPSNASFGLLWPYDRGYRSTMNLTPSGDWKIDLTHGTLVEFLLPQECEPYESSDYRIYPDHTRGGSLVRFVSTSEEWTTGIWSIQFYIVRLRNVFSIEVSSVVLLIGVIVAMFSFRKRRLASPPKKAISTFLPSITGPGLIAFEFLVAGDWFLNIFGETTFAVLLSIQIILAVIAYLLAQKWKFYKQTKT